MTVVSRSVPIAGAPGVFRLVPPVDVEVLADGTWWPGEAIAYSGARLSVRWTRGVAQTHLTWEPATHVRPAPDTPAGGC